MKIGYIVQQFYPTAYGSGVHALELVKELVKFGHEIHIITKGGPGQKSFEIFRGIHIHRFLNFFRVPYYFPLNSIILWIFGKRIIQKLDLDIIIGHGFESSLFFKLRKKIAFIYKAAGTIGLQKFREYITWREHLGKFFFPLLGYFEKTAINHADITIAISETIKQELISVYKVSDKRICRIYNGVDSKRFHPNQNYSIIKNRLGLKSKKIIIFVGRLSSIKGPQLLIHAIPRVIKKFPECFFLFIGDGPLYSYLESLAQKLNIKPFIKFLGFISNSEIPKYFAMADLTIIPSLYEPFGLVALESLASETPVLSSAQGGLAEIHKYLIGLPILTPLNIPTIANHIEALLSNPEKLKQLGQKGRKIIIDKFTWKGCAASTNKKIKKIKK